MVSHWVSENAHLCHPSWDSRRHPRAVDVWRKSRSHTGTGGRRPCPALPTTSSEYGRVEAKDPVCSRRWFTLPSQNKNRGVYSSRGRRGARRSQTSSNDGHRMRQDEVWGPQASDRGYVASGIFSVHLQVLVKSGHAGEYRTSKVGSVSEAEVSFHRKTQSALWLRELGAKSNGCH